MTGHLPYTEEDVELVARLLRGHVVGDPVPLARVILGHQSASNRLVPPGSEVREEWGAEHDDGCDHWGFVSDRTGLMRWLADHPGWRPLHRKTVSFDATPWSPVPDTEEGS